MFTEQMKGFVTFIYARAQQSCTMTVFCLVHWSISCYHMQEICRIKLTLTVYCYCLFVFRNTSKKSILVKLYRIQFY